MNRRPQVTLTFAQSIDGRIATRDGSSQWISGPDTLVLAHELRDRHDAILVGIGTLLADNPRLTCRTPGGASPVRAVLDSDLRVPLDSHFADPTQADSIVFTTENRPAGKVQPLEERGVRVVPVSSDGSGRLDLNKVLDVLGELGLKSLLVEGGSRTITSFMRAEIWDRIVAVIAPMFIGTGTDTVGDLGVTALDAAVRCRTTALRQAGNDVVWELEALRE